MDRDIESYETRIHLWYIEITEPASWESSQIIYSNADARKAALSRISKQMIKTLKQIGLCHYVFVLFKVTILLEYELKEHSKI